MRPCLCQQRQPAKPRQAGRGHSGDSGLLLDAELCVIGRKDDTIIVAGKNMYPQDIEEVAYGHDAVTAAPSPLGSSTPSWGLRACS